MQLKSITALAKETWKQGQINLAQSIRAKREHKAVMGAEVGCSLSSGLNEDKSS